MQRRMIIVVIASCMMITTYVRAEFNVEEWKKVLGDPAARAAVEFWFVPGPERERVAREMASREGPLPTEDAQADAYIKKYIGFHSHFYSVVYKNAKSDSTLAQSVLDDPDFGERTKGNAALLLYINTGDKKYLKTCLLGNPICANQLLSVHDQALVPVAFDIVSEGYKEQMMFIATGEGPGKYARCVSVGLPGLAGTMYVKKAGNLRFARQLFRDVPLFTASAGSSSQTEMAYILYHLAPRQALEDFLYAQYQTGDAQTLANIKRNVRPELADILDKVGQRYRDDVQKAIEQVQATAPRNKTVR